MEAGSKEAGKVRGQRSEAGGRRTEVRGQRSEAGGKACGRWRLEDRELCSLKVRGKGYAVGGNRLEVGGMAMPVEAIGWRLEAWCE